MQAELLKLLTTKVQHFTDSPGGDSLSPEDVAYILSQIHHPNAADYGRLKYANEVHRAPDLAYRLGQQLLNEKKPK